MSGDKYLELNDDELRGLVGRKTRDLVRRLIDEHPVHAGYLLEYCTLLDQLHAAEKTVSERLDAFTIAAVRRHSVEKESIRIKFYHELSFFPAQTVANALNTAEGCRMLIHAWRLISAKLSVPMQLHDDEISLMTLLCGDFRDQEFGSIELQTLFRLLHICNDRFYEDEFKQLLDETHNFSQSVVANLLGKVPFTNQEQIERSLRMAYNDYRLILKSREDFDWKAYRRWQTKSRKITESRTLHRELRQFVSKKLRHLRQRMRHFEMLEDIAPPPVMLSDEELRQISFYQKQCDSLARRVKDNSSILRAIGVVEKINLKPGREVAEIGEFSPDTYIKKAPRPTPPKKTQSSGTQEGDSFNPDQPETVNACGSFGPPANRSEISEAERYHRLSPDFANDQIQEYFGDGRRAGRETNHSDRLRVVKRFFDSVSRKRANQPKPGTAEQNNDLKRSQTWEVAYQEIKPTDCSPPTKKITQQLFHFLAEDTFLPRVKELRRDLRVVRTLLKKESDDASDQRFRASREEQKKKQKKPDSGPNPRK